MLKPLWSRVVCVGVLAATGLAACAETTGSSSGDGAPADRARLDAADVAPPTRCDELTRTRQTDLQTGVTVNQQVRAARLPDTSCSVARAGMYYVHRVVTAERTRFYYNDGRARSVAVRRACDDAATEVLCVRGPVPRGFVLDPGTYDVVAEADEALWPLSNPHAVASTVGPAHSACDSAEPLQLGRPRGNFPWFDVATTPRPGCLDAWRALYYRAVVPAGQRLQVTAQPGTYESSHQATVRILASCDAAACLSAGVAPVGAPANAAWSNTSAAPQPVIVAVAPGTDQRMLSPGDLSSYLHTGPLGDRCEDAPPLSVEAEERIDLVGATASPPSCGAMGPIGPVRFRRVRIPPHHGLLVQARGEFPSPQVRPSLRVYDRCDALACLADRTPGAASNNRDVVSVLNDGDAPRDVVVAVGTAADSLPVGPGMFLVRAALQPLSAGRNCFAPLSVPVDRPVLVSNAATAPLPSCGAGAPAGNALIVQVVVPPRRSITFPRSPLHLLPSEMRLSQLINCPVACRGIVDDLGYVNTGDHPTSLLLALASPGATGTFTGTVHFVTAPLSRPDACTGAAVIPLGVSRLIDDVSVDNPLPCGQRPDVGTSGAVSYRRVMVPAGHVLRARSTELGQTLALLDACDQPTCASGAFAPWNHASSRPFGAWLVNRTSLPREVFLSSIDSNWGRPEVLVEALSIAANGTCAGAVRLDPERSYDGLDAAGGTEPVRVLDDPAYTFGGNVPSVFYRVAVPAGRELRAVFAPPDDLRGSWDLRPAMLDACGGAALASGLTMWWANATSAPRDVVLAVGPAVGSDARFRLALTLHDPVASTPCDRAETVADGATLPDLVLPARTGALSLGGDPRRFLRVEVPAQHSFVMTADRPIDVDVSRRCGDAPWERPSRRLVRLHNYNSGPEVWLLGLRALSTAASRATIRVHISPPAHDVSTSTGPCDALTGPALLDAHGVTPVRALPFPLTWFGEPVAGWSADFNGFLQLHPSLDATPVPSLVRHENYGSAPDFDLLPTRIIAPLLGRLTGLAATSGVRAGVFESPRRHLTVEWRRVQQNQYDWAPNTAQAWLYEDGAVELRYCEVPRWGLPYPDQSVALTDRANTRITTVHREPAVTAGTVLRFTPR